MFNESRLLDSVAYGSSFGQEFSTRITTLRSGHERRNANWARPLGQYSVLFQNLRPEDHALVRRAHMACMGSLVAFRFKDWTDYQAKDQPLATGTGAPQTAQLVKRYQFGAVALDRPIVKPVAGSVVVKAAGLVIPASVDAATGIATFTAPFMTAVTWSGEFDVPVRFVNDRLDSDPSARYQGGFLLSSDVDLVEVRL